jgi:hypothetical protein
MRGGADYDAEWGKRMTGEGLFAQLIARRFSVAARRCGLSGKLAPLDCTSFGPPPRKGDQLSLF